ncbi:hypothetical protein GCM10027346_37710 [Hymenobacter seoulensis]
MSTPLFRQFAALCLAEQVTLLLEKGEVLAHRFEQEDIVFLYQLSDSFVELYYQPEHDNVYQCLLFSELPQRAAYQELLSRAPWPTTKADH